MLCCWKVRGHRPLEMYSKLGSRSVSPLQGGCLLTWRVVSELPVLPLRLVIFQIKHICCSAGLTPTLSSAWFNPIANSVQWSSQQGNVIYERLLKYCAQLQVLPLYAPLFLYSTTFLCFLLQYISLLTTYFVYFGDYFSRTGCFVHWKEISSANHFTLVLSPS